MLWNGKSIIKKSNNTTETMRKLKQLKYVINVEIKYFISLPSLSYTISNFAYRWHTIELKFLGFFCVSRSGV